MKKNNTLWSLMPFLLLVGVAMEGEKLGLENAVDSDAGNTNLAAEVDEELFRQMKGLGDVFAKNEIWRGYAYLNYPQYFIHLNGNRPDRAFLINSPVMPGKAIPLGNNENQGLQVSRYDGHMQAATDALFGPDGNELFDFDFQIAGVSHYLQVFTDDLSRDSDDPTQAVSFSTHELFHRYQDVWEWVPDAKQDFDHFPIRQDLLELQILCQEVLKDLPQAYLSPAKARTLLAQYVAIRTKELALDPTADHLIKHHELYQEQMEGSAKYIETMSNLAFFGNENFTPTFGYSLFEFYITNKEEVRGLVGQSVYYGTGASAIYLLDQVGYPIEEMEKGKTPYELAKAYLNLSPNELSQALAQAKSIPNWTEIQQMAKEWAAY